MHVRGCHQGQDPDLVSGSFLHVDAQVPAPGIQGDDHGIHRRAVDLVFTYGDREKRWLQKEDFQQFRFHHQGPFR